MPLFREKKKVIVFVTLIFRVVEQLRGTDFFEPPVRLILRRSRYALRYLTVSILAVRIKFSAIILVYVSNLRII